MLVRAWLQRRRILFTALFFLLAGLIDIGGEGRLALAPGTVLLLSVGFGGMAGALATVLIPLFPGYRNVAEVTAVGYFLVTLGQAFGLLPGDAFFQTGWGIAAICLGYTGLHNLIYGRWWRRFDLALGWKVRRQFETTAPPDKVWRHLVPNPYAPEEYYSGTLAELLPVPGEPDVWRQRSHGGTAGFMELLVEIEEDVRPHRYVARSRGMATGSHAAYAGGRSSITIADRPGGGSVVTVAESVDRIEVPIALMLWFDGFGHEMAESMRRYVENRPDPTISAQARRRMLGMV